MNQLENTNAEQYFGLIINKRQSGDSALDKLEWRLKPTGLTEVDLQKMGKPAKAEEFMLNLKLFFGTNLQ